jgi:tetratricopeptide (TPR) repeat protein
LLAGGLTGGLSGTSSISVAQEETSGFSVFQMPAMSEELSEVFKQLKAGQFDAAEAQIQKVISDYPDRAQNYYILATLLATRNKPKEALAALESAIDKGFRNAKMMQTDRNLNAIRPLPKFQELTERILKENALGTNNPSVPKIEPYAVRNQEALISNSNTVWDHRFGILQSAFLFPTEQNSSRLVDSQTHPIAMMLNALYAEGSSAGNIGDLYDNRDRQHSSLKQDDYPQLSFTTYSEEAIKAGTDYGLNTKILFNAITFGNSSTTVGGGPFWRSLGRLGTTFPIAAKKLYLQYVFNHLYVYPAVMDYSPKVGDVLLANTPYMILTRGESGSDRPMLHVIAGLLSAFRPDVKTFLKNNRLVMPTLQMILRDGHINLFREQDYLTYKAHPPVFDSTNLDMSIMVRRANQLQIKDVPPMVQLSIVSESKLQKGIDDFANIKSETIFNTPGAIARAVRSTAQDTKLVVSAENTKPVGDQKLTYHWVVLRGDADRIKITPQNEDGSVVEISVPWHAPFPAPERPDLTTRRVEIGAFVHNGTNYSAPAFVNFVFPENQLRTYGKDGRIMAIDHQPSHANGKYVDPEIFAERDWLDEYHYDDNGDLIGWSRKRGNVSVDYTHDGAKVIETDPQGRATKAKKVSYMVEKKKNGYPIVVEQETDAILLYSYADANDRIGKASSN